MQLVARDDAAWPGGEGVAHSAPVSLPSCRRAASFPYFGDHLLSPTLASKGRSLSESQGLNRFYGDDILAALRAVEGHTELPPLPSPIAEEDDTLTTFGEPDDLTDYETEGPVTDDSCVLDELSSLDLSDTRPQRRVRFCDEVGRELASIRVLDLSPTAPPPIIPQAVLDRHREKEPLPKATWKVSFEQPASNWHKFNETFRAKKIALENAVVSNCNNLLCTLKVDTSLGMEHTQVFARYTKDNWKSFEDVPALPPTRSRCGSFHCYSLHIELPPDAKPGDFVYMAFFARHTPPDGGWASEYWDSNDGHNYMFEVPLPAIERFIPPPASQTSWPQSFSPLDKDDAYRLHYDNWSKFASWKNLSTEGPYW